MGVTIVEAGVTGQGGGGTTTTAENAPDPTGLFGLFSMLEAQFHGGTCGCSGCCGYEYELSEDGLSYNRVETGDGEPAAVYRFPSEAFATGAGNAASTAAGGIDFTLTIEDLTGEAEDFIDDVQSTMESVFATLSNFIDGLGTLDIEIEIEQFDSDGPGLTLASAGPTTTQFTGRQNGLDIFTPGTIVELTTGVDPNGARADGGITINLDFLQDAFIDADVQEEDDVPGGSIDLFSVLLHEMFHVLGFIGFRDAETFEPDGGDGTNFDAFVDFDDDGLPVFIGPNAVAVYGAPVPLESTRDGGSNIYHIGDEPTGGQATLRSDLDNALTSSAASFGDREIIGALELAILQDLGLDVVIPEERQIIDFLDNGTFPNLDVTAAASGGGRIVAFEEDGVLDLTILRDGLANGLPSVGFELISGTAVEGEDFVAQRDRFVFVPQTLDGTVTIDLIDDDVFDGGEVLTLRLFNPANSFLEGGATFQDFEIVIIDSDAPVGVRDDADVLRFFDVENGFHVFAGDEADQDALLADPVRFFFQGVGFESLDPAAPGARALFSFTNPQTGVRFLTLDAQEAEAFSAANPDFIVSDGDPILAASIELEGTAPVFRFFNTVNGDYLYTLDPIEAETIRTDLPQFEDQGVAFFAAVNVADVLRFFDLEFGVHVFTSDVSMQNELAGDPERFFFEGIGFASLDATSPDADEVFAFIEPDSGTVFFTLDAVEAVNFEAANPDFQALTGAPIFASAVDSAETSPVFRFFNTATGGYFYTQDETEAAAIRADLPAFEDQGVVFFAPDPQSVATADLDSGDEPLMTLGDRLDDLLI